MPRRTELTAHQREALVDEIATACRRFMTDVGALLAGGADELDEHVDPACADALRRDLCTSDVVLAPDFGEWAQLTIQGPLSSIEPARVHVDFTDATTATDLHGRPLQVVPHEIRVSLVIDPVTMRVLDASFAALP